MREGLRDKFALGCNLFPMKKEKKTTPLNPEYQKAGEKAANRAKNNLSILLRPFITVMFEICLQ